MFTTVEYCRILSAEYHCRILSRISSIQQTESSNIFCLFGIVNALSAVNVDNVRFHEP